MNQTDHALRNDNLDKRADTLQQYVSDMLATEQHIQEAIERQLTDKSVQHHVEALERHLVALKGSSSAAKAAITSVLGLAAGLYDKARTQPVSRMLRDDYMAFSLAAISYTMLYTTGQALYDSSTLSLAQQHLKDFTALLNEIRQIMPQVVVAELIAEHPDLDSTSATASLRQTQAAWTAEPLS